jgi:hypothetical protein
VWKESTGIINDGLASNPIALFRNNLSLAMITGTAQALGKEFTHVARQRLFDGWYKLIKDYTHRSLTVVQDRLPAVLGIANAFRSEFSGRYIWGLWESELLRGLLWSIDTESIAYKRLASPSSSWAAWNAPVHFRLLWDQKSLRRAVVDNVEEQITTKRLKGHIASKTCIRIRGPLMKISVLERSKGRGINCLLFDKQKRYIGAACLDSPPSFSISQRDMWVLMLYTDGSATPIPLEASKAEMPHTYCLVLEKRRENTYRRIGYAETSTNEFDDVPTKLVAII